MRFFVDLGSSVAIRLSKMITVCAEIFLCSIETTKMLPRFLLGLTGIEACSNST